MWCPEEVQNPFLTAQSTQIKSVISVPIKDFIHHYPRALFNDIPRVGAHFYDIPGSGRTFTTYPGRDALLRHTRVGAQFYDIPGSIPRRYIDVCYCDMFSVVNVYLDHLKFYVVCINSRRYVCCSEYDVVSNECNEPTSCLVQPIGAR